MVALIPNYTKPWIELTIENWLKRGGCPKNYIHMVKIVLKSYGILRIVIYHHAPQPTYTEAYFIS
jgi:hypothetical protein